MIKNMRELDKHYEKRLKDLESDYKEGLLTFSEYLYCLSGLKRQYDENRVFILDNYKEVGNDKSDN